MGLMSMLAEMLPPPSYLAMPGAGVDISDTSMKYVAFSSSLRTHRKPKLLTWGDIEIPANVLNRGLVLDVGKLTAVLKEFREKTGIEFVRVSLPEERAYLFETEIKRDIPFKEIKSTLEFRLEENVPIPSREAFFDYDILPVTSSDRMVRVVVATYARETILQYYDACLAAGLTPLSFEVEAQAMARSVIPHNQSGVTMLIDFGKTRTGVGIVQSGVLLYTSTIDIGGNQLSQVLRKVLGDLPEEDLTRLKNTQGLIRGVDDSRAHDALISTISVIKDEIATRMQYWHQKEKYQDARRIKQVVFCGGSVNLKGLPEYLTETLGLPCTRGNVWTNVLSFDETLPPIERRFSYGYATAIGLALKQTV